MSDGCPFPAAESLVGLLFARELFVTRRLGESAPAELIPASSDVSFRRYFRWQGRDRSLVVMDAPPPQEDCRPFGQGRRTTRRSRMRPCRGFSPRIRRTVSCCSVIRRQTYSTYFIPGNADELFEPAPGCADRLPEGHVAGVLPAYDKRCCAASCSCSPTGNTWPATSAWSWRARRWPAGSDLRLCWYAARWSNRGSSSIATICRAT